MRYKGNAANTSVASEKYSSPNSIAIGNQYAFVSNATNDNISVIDYRTGKIVKHIQLQITPVLDSVRGYLPFGITLSPDQKTNRGILPGKGSGYRYVANRSARNQTNFNRREFIEYRA